MVSSVPSLDGLQADFVETLLPVLLKTPVLALLSFRQRTLDSLDIEGLAALWARIHADSDPFFDAAEPTLEEWTHFVDVYLAGEPDWRQETEEAELRYHCLAYLLSATFKDCSVVVHFGPRSERLPVVGDAHIAKQDRGPCAVAPAEVKLIDLDVKCIRRLAKWERMDGDIVSAYARVDDPRTCLDSLSRVCSLASTFASAHCNDDGADIPFPQRAWKDDASRVSLPLHTTVLTKM